MYDTFKCNNEFSYLVVKEREDLYGVYLCEYNHKKLITHKSSLKMAQKTAKILQAAFKLGFSEAKNLHHDPYG